MGRKDSWRVPGAKEQARVWLRDSGGSLQVAHLIASTPEYEPMPTHETPRTDNIIAVGDTPPYTGRLRDLDGATYRLLGALQPKGALAMPGAVGGDWIFKKYNTEEFVEFASTLKNEGQIDGVALLFMPNGMPTHQQGSYSDWYGAIPVGIGPLRSAARSL